MFEEEACVLDEGIVYWVLMGRVLKASCMLDKNIFDEFVPPKPHI